MMPFSFGFYIMGPDMTESACPSQRLWSLFSATFYKSVFISSSPRFLCRPTTLYIIARAVERQSAIYTENG
jgi:hypothetical protein